MEAIQSSLSKLRLKIDDSPGLQKLEIKTKIPKEYFVLGVVFVAALAFIFGVGVGILCNTVGFIFPAFKSVQAVESHSSSDVTQWLVYWVVYALFSVIEIFADTLVYWIPLYYRLKLGFLVWAMMPQTRGAKTIYDNFLQDLVKVKKVKVDETSAPKKVGAVSKATVGNRDNTEINKEKEEWHEVATTLSIPEYKESILILISNGVADYQQKANQKAALQFLNDLKIPHEIVDGMDQSQIEKRNRLFGISGIRGNYPQLFICKEGNDQPCFLGGYDWLECQDSTSMAKILG